MAVQHPRPTPDDGVETETSKLQADTEDILLRHLPLDPSTPPTLQRNAHLQFLLRNLTQGFPSRYASQDASQPWLIYWTLQGFSILQVGLDPANKQRVIDTVLAWQHPDGGFGGGPGQAAHLLPTYAAVCALAIAGRPGPGGGWDEIDRAKLYAFFLSLKQPDGSFLVAHHAEVDVRGIYCLLVTACLLDLLTPALVAGTSAFLASCQTYEGGFSSSSHPAPLGEAHGGYTFCALASWAILEPLRRANTDDAHVDMRKLARWLAQMQGAVVELGGFRGRTNKLVDGCYAWWVGGACALVDALYLAPPRPAPAEAKDGDDESAWTDADESIFDREALQTYILYPAQHPAGGLRDKPPKSADAYHTLYCLSGLSASQHRVLPCQDRRSQLAAAWTPPQTSFVPLEGDALDNEARKEVFLHALAWNEEEGATKIVGAPGNRVNATHPLFNLTMTHTEAIMGHFYTQSIPPRAKKTA